ncbi:MAG: hypothetical protein EKK34_25260 [Mycobacterium sp.]|nr:MAG: hypothetical protein EKK34_25260 [Mycobacterium sp.]
MSWKRVASPDDARVEMRVRPGDNFHYVKVSPEYWLAQTVVVASFLATNDSLSYPRQPDPHEWREEFLFGGQPGGGKPVTRKTELQHPQESKCSHSIKTRVSASPANSYIKPAAKDDVHNFSC